MTLSVSRKGVLFLARREGLVLVAYRDGQHHSIGFGHNSKTLRADDRITVRDAFRLLADDVRKREPEVRRAITVPVKQNQFDAIFSLYYQGGSDGLRAVSKYVNRGDLRSATCEFLKWDTNAAGVHLLGLLKRRALEVAIFAAAEYGALSPVPMWTEDPTDKSNKPTDYEITEEDLRDANLPEE